MIETKKRTIARTVTYRISAFLITIVLTYIVTKNLLESSLFSLFLHLILSIDYYFHERIWLKIKWGLNNV